MYDDDKRPTALLHTQHGTMSDDEAIKYLKPIVRDKLTMNAVKRGRYTVTTHSRTKVRSRMTSRSRSLSPKLCGDALTTCFCSFLPYVHIGCTVCILLESSFQRRSHE
jgi:hypothetical protein